MVGRALQMASRLMVARGAGARAAGRLWVCPPLRRLPGLLGRPRAPGPAPRARAGAAGPSQPPRTRSRGSPSPARPEPAAAFWSRSGLSRGPGSTWAAATRRGGASSPDLALLGAPASRARRSELLPPRTSRATSAADTEAGMKHLFYWDDALVECECKYYIQYQVHTRHFTSLFLLFLFFWRESK
ncbi:uncharacterized protein LOC121042669 [Herpailurus yagouaroundi]|uniref:uncharacterized protein LOC121042669 n=1 Tax=Herpailurus yagouaroundi TaxID=1608482 RepID=UPI001AD6B7A0|nr:uncharacterized protein LOC121042669 [Puma yagouaroundi]